MGPSHEFWEVVGKLCLAAALSGILGLERERKGRTAGLRTHILVCLGATLAMIVSEMLAREWAQNTSNLRLDSGRIAAGILTGIGFIGAGAIINVGSFHRGLTTAALLWFVSIVGITIGAGFYPVAIVATVLAFLTVTALSWITMRVATEVEFALSIEMPGGLSRIDELERFIQRQGHRVTASRLRVVGRGDSIDMTFEVISKPGASIETFIQALHDRFSEVQRITIKR